MPNYGESIKAVRVRQNVSQVELARRLGVAPANVCRMEGGANSPSLRTLEKVADALGVSLVNLLDATTMSAPSISCTKPLSAMACEAKGVRLTSFLDEDSFGSLDAEVQKEVLAREREYLRLEERLGVPHATLLQLANPLDVSTGGAEAVARSLRASCDAGTATLADLSSLLEYRNVRIHFTRLPSQVQSMGFYDEAHRSVSFVLSESDTAERHVYRLAYELGLACLFASSGYGPLRNRAIAHRFARTFAAAFLMPAEAVRLTVAQTGLRPSRWSLDSLLALKARFNVSAESFALRLEELGLISPGLRRELREKLRAYYKEHPAAMEPQPCLKPLERYARLGVMREAVENLPAASHICKERGRGK